MRQAARRHRCYVAFAASSLWHLVCCGVRVCRRAKSSNSIIMDGCVVRYALGTTAWRLGPPQLTPNAAAR